MDRFGMLIFQVRYFDHDTQAALHRHFEEPEVSSGDDQRGIGKCAVPPFTAPR